MVPLLRWVGIGVAPSEGEEEGCCKTYVLQRPFRIF